MTSHVEQPIVLLKHLREILNAVGTAEQVEDDSHQLFLERFDELIQQLPVSIEAIAQGQEIMSQVFHRYPQIAHLVPRDLLWYFGGDCLHFMPDEEIEMFQILEERRYEAEQQGKAFDWYQEKHLLQLPTEQTQH